MKSLKKITRVVCLSALLWTVVQGAQPSASQEDSAVKSHKSRFSLKLNGGLAFPDTGDINGMIRSYKDATAQIIADGQSAVLDWKEIKSVWEGTVELQFALTDRVSLGLETGFMRKRFPGTWTINSAYAVELNGGAVQNSAYNVDDKFADSFNVIPVVLSGYYFFRYGKCDFYLKGGIGCYFGRYGLNETTSTETIETTDLYEDDTYVDSYILYSKVVVANHGVAHTAEVGLHAGIGMEWKLSGRIALNIEGLFRAADLKRWSGYVESLADFTDRQGYQSDNPETSVSRGKSLFSYPLLYCYSTQCESSTGYVYIKKVAFNAAGFSKRASLRLDGLSFRVGLKIGL